MNWFSTDESSIAGRPLQTRADEKSKIIWTHGSGNCSILTDRFVQFIKPVKMSTLDNIAPWFYRWRPILTVLILTECPKQIKTARFKSEVPNQRDSIIILFEVYYPLKPLPGCAVSV